ncbi:uncharacterized protein CLUP02_10675 [Colletotrichum lupini]|uniref:Uncharacterized protein n=1 Tax=Colletotrichum lupini TaxID=145971 RepID=A0A9Q8WJ03_9PEZI|nr:uncharacterized protein CLUP02_10675 [Colletotrichum lupini]UQC85179.1 hypothetical protein CLUP02_10675 [Colletotrichum lupini]
MTGKSDAYVYGSFVCLRSMASSLPRCVVNGGLESSHLARPNSLQIRSDQEGRDQSRGLIPTQGVFKGCFRATQALAVVIWVRVGQKVNESHTSIPALQATSNKRRKRKKKKHAQAHTPYLVYPLSRPSTQVIHNGLFFVFTPLVTKNPEREQKPAPLVQPWIVSLLAGVWRKGGVCSLSPSQSSSSSHLQAWEMRCSTLHDRAKVPSSLTHPITLPQGRAPR